MHVLSVSTYREIQKYLEKSTGELNDFKIYDQLKLKFPLICENTLGSILHFYNIKNNKKNSKYTTAIKSELQDVYTQKKKGAILQYARKYKLAPTTVAKQFLQVYLEATPAQPSKKFDPQHLNEILRDPTLIEDPYVFEEVIMALMYDFSYSPMSLNIRRQSGKDFEYILQDCLQEKEIPFKTEEQLRNLKYARTPDIMLDLPIAVDNHIIKWIESKALFADDLCHLNYTESQFRHYYEYGPGLVIYWFGYTTTIKYDEKKMFVLDKFPENIVKMDVCVRL